MDSTKQIVTDRLIDAIEVWGAEAIVTRLAIAARKAGDLDVFLAFLESKGLRVMAERVRFVVDALEGTGPDGVVHATVTIEAKVDVQSEGTAIVREPGATSDE